MNADTDIDFKSHLHDKHVIHLSAAIVTTCYAGWYNIQNEHPCACHLLCNKRCQQHPYPNLLFPTQNSSLKRSISHKIAMKLLFG